MPAEAMTQGVSPARVDSLRSALDSVFAAPAYRWEAREDPFGAVRRLWLALREWLFQLQRDNPQAFRALTWVLVAILAVILAHAAWVAFRTVRGGSRAAQREVAGPATAPRDAAWYAQEASRLAAAGDYAGAMQADFLRLVLELDARAVMRFHPSKTPVEYVRDAALAAEGRETLRALVRDMYAHAFARVPLDRAGYDRWRALAAAERFSRVG